MASWRYWARVVSIVDLVLFSLGLLALLVGLIFAADIAAAVTQAMYDQHQEMHQHEDWNEDMPLWILQVIFLVMAAMMIPFIILEIFLFKATKEGVDTGFALKVTKIWRVVYIVVAVLSVIRLLQLMIPGNLLFFQSLIQFAILLLFIYVVHKYIKELEELQVSRRGSVAFQQKTNFV